MAQESKAAPTPTQSYGEFALVEFVCDVTNVDPVQRKGEVVRQYRATPHVSLTASVYGIVAAVDGKLAALIPWGNVKRATYT